MARRRSRGCKSRRRSCDREGTKRSGFPPQAGPPAISPGRAATPASRTGTQDLIQTITRAKRAATSASVRNSFMESSSGLDSEAMGEGGHLSDDPGYLCLNISENWT